MKKIFNAIIFAACVFTAASFTSCCKDNDGFIDDAGEVIGGGDDGGGGSGDSQGQTSGNFEYFEPYTAWKSDKAEVMKYMEGLPGWTLTYEDKNIAKFEKDKPKMSVAYNFNYDGKVFYASVSYNDASHLEDLKKKLEDKYNCTFNKKVEGYFMESYQSDDVTENGVTGFIVISVTRTTESSAMFVTYTF